MYYTYILRNYVTNRYYVGYTPDLKSRLAKHKNGRVLSTKSNLNYELEWYCGFKTRHQALSFEKYLKTGSGIAFTWDSLKCTEVRSIGLDLNTLAVLTLCLAVQLT